MWVSICAAIQGCFSACKTCVVIQSAFHGGKNLGYFLLDKLIDLEVASDSPAQWIWCIHSQAIKTASLDHITQPSVLSSSPPECLLCRYETSWNEEKETQWPLLRERQKKKKKERGGGGNQMRTSSRLSLQCPPICHWWSRTPSNVSSLHANIPLQSSGHRHGN